MTDLETRIREEFGRVPVPAGDLARVVGRSRVRRIRRGAGVATLAAIVVAGIALPLWMLVPRGAAPTPSGEQEGAEAPPAPSGETARYADGGDGVAVSIPSDWTYHEDPSGPDDPKTLLAFGSWPFEEGGDCAPTAAQAELPADGALVWVMEYLNQPPLDADIGPYPSDFRFDEETFATYECSQVPSYMFRFRGPGGRAFQAHVALGPEVTEETRGSVQRAVRSIEVTAPIPEGCPADFGPWADPDCPAQAWVRAVVEAAGHSVTGDTGSALEVDAAGHRIHLWAFVPEGDRPYSDVIAEESYEPYATVDGTDVFSDGVRITWQADGLWVWLSSATSDPLPPRDVIEGLVRGSLEVDYDSIDTR